MLKVIFFTAVALFFLIPNIAYGSEITAEPEKTLFDPNEWLKIFVEIDGYSGGDVTWSATMPDGTITDGILSSIKASKSTHTIIRNAFDGQFGTWKIQYDYNDAVTVIDVEVEPLTVSVTTDKPSYLPWDTVIVRVSTNYYEPSAAKAETVTIDVLDDDGTPAKFFDDVKIKMYQPVIVQHFLVDDLLSQNPFGVYRVLVNYYGITTDASFELANPDNTTSIFLSSDKKVYSPDDVVELNIVISEIVSDTGMLSIVLPSGQLITKSVAVSDSITRIILDDINTSKTGLYSLGFDYGASHAIGSFDVYDETLDDSDVSGLELDVMLSKSQYRPGETIQATIGTSNLINNPVSYWFEDSQANRGQQFSFATPTSGKSNLSHIIPVDFLQGPSKLHVKYGDVETFAIFFVSGEPVTPSEISEIDSYVGPEILLTIDKDTVEFGDISDISVSTDLELFVVDSGTSKIHVFDLDGNLINSWDASTDDGASNIPVSVTAEESVVHVSDAKNSRIISFDKDGNFIREWGNSGISYQSVQSPTDIAADDSGTYYVSDGNQNKILKYDSDGNHVGEINSILTASAKFASVESITADDDDVFLLSTANNRILHFHSNGGFLKSFGTVGQGDKQFQSPVSLDFDNNNLYVSDSGNNRVLVLDTAGEYVAKWGTFGNGPGQFNRMAGIDVDPNGDVWVADSGNRIQKFASISNIAKPGIPEWVKHNSAWWSEGQIDDGTFVEAIRYLINEKIISVSDVLIEEPSSEIPSWVKTNAGWWAEGIIDEQTFVNGIEFLVKTGIIQVNAN